eukprot:Hpha_TRINITY_DN22422_c0_g1::TRINITY_DN22422_c0_g1_i1::g.95055::m.95055
MTVIAVVLLGAYASQCSTFTYGQVDLHGNDIAQKSDISLNECTALCCETALCVSVVHLAKNVPNWGSCQNASSCCYMKSVDHGKLGGGGDHHTVVHVVKLKERIEITLGGDLGYFKSVDHLVQDVRDAANISESVSLEFHGFITETSRNVTIDIVGPYSAVMQAVYEIVEQGSSADSELRKMLPTITWVGIVSMSLTANADDMKDVEEKTRAFIFGVLFGLVIGVCMGVLSMGIANRYGCRDGTSTKAEAAQPQAAAQAAPQTAPRELNIQTEQEEGCGGDV